MRMLSEYLEHAVNSERMAAEEDNPMVKAQFESRLRPIASSRKSARLSTVRRRQAPPTRSQNNRRAVSRSALGRLFSRAFAKTNRIFDGLFKGIAY